MATLEEVKNNLIGQIWATQNEKLLHAIVGIFESVQGAENVQLSSEQLELIVMGEQDILNGKLVSEEDLEKSDAAWLG